MTHNPNDNIKQILANNFLKLIGTDGINNSLIKARFPNWKKSKVFLNEYNTVGNRYALNTYSSPLFLLTMKNSNKDSVKKLIQTILSNRMFILRNIKDSFRKVFENISPSDKLRTDHSDKIPYHQGALNFLKDIGLISYNPNPKCYFFAGASKCKLNLI